MSSTKSRGLNPEQEAVVVAGDGPIMVLAGAGTGKTRVLVQRIAHLVQSGVPAWTILAVTFTNKAAKEMRDRLRQLLGDVANEMSIGTFHATSARLLRAWGSFVEVRKGFAIFDDDDQLRLVDRILKELGLSEQLSPRTLLSMFDRAKNRGEDPVKAAESHFFGDVVAQVFPRYRDQLHKENAVDFNDLLLKALELTRHPDIGNRVRTRYAHILVDEFQDTNRVQYDLVCGLAATRNLMVVGDDDQSIYGWRGAEPKNLLDFDRDFPDAAVIKLEQNYRSTQVVLDAANAVISKNRDRRGKELWTEQSGGELIATYQAGDERGEAFFIAKQIREMIDEGPYSPSDFAVLYRTNAQSRVLEEHMRAMRVPAKVVGAMSFYERKEVKDAIAYLRLLVNPSADSAFERIVNVPTRGIGDTTVDRLRKAAMELAGRGGGGEADERDAHNGNEPMTAAQLGTGSLFSRLLDDAAAKRSGAAASAAAAEAAASAAAAAARAAAAMEPGGDGSEEPPPPPPPASLGPSLLDMCRSAGGGEVAGIATAARKKLAGFAELIDGLVEVIAAGASVAEILIQIVERSGLREKLEKEDTPESRDRLANLAELVTTASDFDDETGETATVEDFLERIALSSNSDQSASPEQVTLTTIHVAKGLEFPVVFLAGMEDGLFPSLREREGQDEDVALEEERRLAYVAITRAKQKLTLSMARTRRVWGQIHMQEPSRFFEDIPVRCLATPPRARQAGGLGEHGLEALRAAVTGGRPAAGRPTAGRTAKPRRSYDELDQRTHDDREPVFQVESYEQAEPSGPSSGSKVNHAAFGVGRVVDSTGAGRDLKVTVDFPSVGRKTVLARYLIRDN